MQQSQKQEVLLTIQYVCWGFLFVCLFFGFFLWKVVCSFFLELTPWDKGMINVLDLQITALLSQTRN